MTVPVLVVSGSARGAGHSRMLADVALSAASAAGAQARLLDLADTQLPVMVEDDAAQNALSSVKLVRETAVWANGFILVTPEYHGGIGGALKNWFDFLYPEFAGKFAAVLSATGGGSGDGSATEPGARRSVPSTVTKLGQKPLRQDRSTLHEDWFMRRLRPRKLSTGMTAAHCDCSTQSPQPSHTRSLMNARTAA